jgi:hypothetical protein
VSTDEVQGVLSERGGGRGKAEKEFVNAHYIFIFSNAYLKKTLILLFFCILFPIAPLKFPNCSRPLNLHLAV